MIQEITRIKGFSSRGLHQLVSRQQAAFAVYILTQPVNGTLQLTLTNLFGEVRQRAAHRVEELRSHHSAECIGREITEQLRWPMDIL